ncbi:MAG TPA: nuclear transport factor 2 family protein [Candidatus Eisenbacteria bacterium]|nr:nuclear transport factor 2 family protein [Candidatus Eisenbacteria bacterium]
MAVYEAAVAAPGARLAVILGSPGLGKSRLLAELARRLGDRSTVLAAHCDAAGGATFAPLVAALRTCLGLDDGADRDAVRTAVGALVSGDESARIADGIAALLAGTPASPEETFFVVRRLLAAIAATRPVVLAIDDLQWAEPLLLDLTEHLVQWSAGVPLLVLVAARPELRELRSSLAAPGALVADVVTLGGLDAAAATRLAANVVGADALPAAIAGRVLATSEGNPLFVGELVRMLVQDGALKREGGRWVMGVELAALEMPPTIQALLAARIERLRPEERTVLERAAVVGRQFSRTAVAQLLPRDVADLDARLESLRRSELIEPDVGWLLGEPVLRFHHVLIRDAAYRRVLKGTRAELHARFADWLEAKAGEAVEHDETLGWHLEQAHQSLRDLGPLDVQGRALGERAARHLAAAGRRALARDDVPVAASLLGRALARLDETDPARADLALDWCEALLASGDVATAAKGIAELGRFADGSDRLRGWHTCLAGQHAVLTDPQSLRATVDAVAAAADTLAAAGDAAGEAKAHHVHAMALARLGKVGECEAALDRALAAARRGHDRRRANAVLSGVPLAALWGPSPVTRASGRCLDVVRVLRITQGAPAVEAVALRCQGVLEALRGRTDAARRMLASSRRLVEELGITQRLLEADVAAGQIELYEGDAAAAERGLRAAYEGLRSLGLRIDAAQAAALLGRALLALGRDADAEALSHQSEALAGDDLRAAVAWRGVRAEALARRGEHAAAVELARAAVGIASTTDALLDHADARRALGAALRAAGRSGEADAEDARTIELWEAKGATLLVEQARRVGRTAERREPAPAARPVRGRASRRRVRANAVVANVARFDAAIAARDAGALATLLRDDHELVDHPNGRTYGRAEVLDYLDPIIRAKGLAFSHEPVATLGTSLALCRGSQSVDELAEADGASFGKSLYEFYIVIEGDADRHWRVEQFADDHLGDAVARLYARHAEILPDGAARERAAATARSVGTVLLTWRQRDFMDSYAAAVDPAIEFVDHQQVGLGSARGAERFLRGLRAFVDLTDDSTVRVDDVLGLGPDALLIRQMVLGTARAGGGPYERHHLSLWGFGANGLLTRLEWYPADREDEALARFDALAAASPAGDVPRPVRPRVRANVATAQQARLDAAIAARDADAMPALFAQDGMVVHHPTGVDYDVEGILVSYRSLLSTRDLRHRFEPLATLGDRLALSSLSVSTSGGGDSTAPLDFSDFGAIEGANVTLIDVDPHGLLQRAEFFAADRLGDGVVRLYERYAELLPAGPARDRAAATARSLAAYLGRLDVDRMISAVAPGIEYADHRHVGFGAMHGIQEFGSVVRSLFEAVDDVANRVDDVVDLRPGAGLLRLTNFGTDRASGGPYERPCLFMWVSGTDGLMATLEQFDVDHEAEALARFDELAAAAAPSPAPMRRVRPNAATAHAARCDVAATARDVKAALAAEIAPEAVFVHHPTGTTSDRQAALSQETLFASLASVSHEALATLGDSLALCRRSVSFRGVQAGDLDVGPAAVDAVVLIEVDAQGRNLRLEIFADDHQADAVARLYERYAETLPAGSARERAAATARAVAVVVDALDIESARAVVAPTIEYVDHRRLGFGTGRGVEAYLSGVRSLWELAENLVARIDDVLALRSDALLCRRPLFGTDRASGGPFEQEALSLWRFGADGRVTRSEFFDVDRVVEALARFDELAVEPSPARSAPSSRVARKVARRIRPNAATAHAARLDAAMAARDLDALAALSADESETIDHPTGTTYDNMGDLASRRMMLRARDLQFHHEPLATLGESLALLRLSISASGVDGGRFDVGAYERELLVLSCGDTDTRRRQAELFAVDRLGDAVVRLYERYAELLRDGPARTRAAATARSVAAMLGPVDPDRIATGYAPAVEAVDHRVLGTWSARGAEAVLQHHRSLREVAVDIAVREDDVLGLGSDALLVRRTHVGTDRAGGGAYERVFLMLWVFGTDGLVTRIEYFDVDAEADALARFDALAAEPPATPLITNTATRSWDRHREAWEARDWDRFVAIHAPGFRQIDRRTMMHLESMRLIFDMTSARISASVLATRGERLALQRGRFEGTDRNVGPSEADWLLVVEVDDAGDRVAIVLLDPKDLDGAYAELDDRYAAGEAAPYARTWETLRRFERAVAARDWDELASVFDPALVLEDHRPVGWATLQSRDEYLASVRTLVDLAPDVTFRVDHVLALDERRALAIVRWTGSREGGPFEMPLVAVPVFDSDGRVQRFDTYNLDQLDAARARFEAVRADAARVPLAALARPNAASTAGDRWFAAFAARDWATMRALCAPDAKFEDRRRLARVSGDVDWWIADAQRTASMCNVRVKRQLVGTAGDRVALGRFLLTGDSGGTAAARAPETSLISSMGQFEIEYLALAEVDESGRTTAGVIFDADDWRAATREAYGRWFARDAVAAAAVGPAFELVEAFNDRDRTRMRAALADDFVLDDHRPARLGVIEGADAWVEACAATWDLAPNSQIAVACTLAHARYGSAILVRLSGTLRDGGVFESPSVAVFIVADGRITRQELFEPEQVDAALARFAELRPDPLRIPPNAATRACDRVDEAGDAQDWDALQALCAPTLEYDDRRRGLRTSGDLETCLTSWRYIFSHGARPARTLLATSGDRLALYRMLWTGADDQPAYEIDTLLLTEVDAEGRIVARIIFDPDDRRGAFVELLERFARSDAHRRVPAIFFELGRALNGHDLDRLRALHPRDFVFDDHRRTGVGRLEGIEAYLAAVAALIEQSPDVSIEVLYTIALEKHGMLSVARRYGTLAEGGGTFESVYVQLFHLDGDRFVGVEIFEVEDLDVARARFAELRPDPLRIPPNAATHACDRLHEAGEAQDWDALRALCAPTLVYDDRRRGLRTSGDLEMYLASMQYIHSRRSRATRTLLATSGDRLALYRQRWTRVDDQSAYEIETLSLTEVDAEGRIVARIVFDPDDRRAANLELVERLARSAGRGVSPLLEWRRGLIAGDLERIRAVLPDDFVYDDHRRSGAGRLETADAYLAWTRSLFEQCPDAISEPMYEVASGNHGILAVSHAFGTLAEGGSFESVFVNLIRLERGRPVAVEIFELEDLDVARARFAELRPDATRIPPNAACRVRDRMLEAARLRRWEALRALASPDFTFDDRRKRSMVTGDFELYTKNMEFIRSQPRLRVTRELLGTTGDRIAVERLVQVGGPDGGEFEIDLVALVEVDAAGRLVAVVNWDPDDRYAAFDEAHARFVAGEAGSAPAQAVILALDHALTRRDWLAFRACLADDLVYRDHRKLGLGTLACDELVAAVRVHRELASDLRTETHRLLAWNRHGCVAVMHQYGTVPDGGPFENVFLRMVVADGDRVRHFETFDVADADQALARFEELCAEHAREPAA